MESAKSKISRKTYELYIQEEKESIERWRKQCPEKKFCLDVYSYNEFLDKVVVDEEFGKRFDILFNKAKRLILLKI